LWEGDGRCGVCEVAPSTTTVVEKGDLTKRGRRRRRRGWMDEEGEEKGKGG
jgi:hypothetical protein